jgi:hypothetical protein
MFWWRAWNRRLLVAEFWLITAYCWKLSVNKKSRENISSTSTVTTEPEDSPAGPFRGLSQNNSQHLCVSIVKEKMTTHPTIMSFWSSCAAFAAKAPVVTTTLLGFWLNRWN